jgi:hypothetical protein
MFKFYFEFLKELTYGLQDGCHKDLSAQRFCVFIKSRESGLFVRKPHSFLTNWS